MAVAARLLWVGLGCQSIRGRFSRLAFLPLDLSTNRHWMANCYRCAVQILISWSSLYRLDDCNSMVDCFYIYTTIHQFICIRPHGSIYVICLTITYIPVHGFIRFHSDKPWINDRFKQLNIQRQHAWQRQDISKHRTLRNLVRRTAFVLPSGDSLQSLSYYNALARSLYSRSFFDDYLGHCKNHD